MYKAENGNPRRRITVDELVALSRVFDIPVPDLLLPPEVVADRKALELLDKLRRATDAAEDAFHNLAQHWAAHPRIAKVLHEHLTDDDQRSAFNAAMRRARREAKQGSDGS